MYSADTLHLLHLLGTYGMDTTEVIRRTQGCTWKENAVARSLQRCFLNEESLYIPDQTTRTLHNAECCLVRFSFGSLFSYATFLENVADTTRFRDLVQEFPQAVHHMCMLGYETSRVDEADWHLMRTPYGKKIIPRLLVRLRPHTLAMWWQRPPLDGSLLLLANKAYKRFCPIFQGRTPTERVNASGVVLDTYRYLPNEYHDVLPALYDSTGKLMHTALFPITDKISNYLTDREMLRCDEVTVARRYHKLSLLL